MELTLEQIFEAYNFCVTFGDNCNVCPAKELHDCSSQIEYFINYYIQKYKWHDLRKDPDDLPTDPNKEYYVTNLLDDGEHFFKYNELRCGAYIIHHSVKSDNIVKIIAWREIDEFESEG